MKKKMLFSASLALLLSACGGSGSNANEPSSNSSSDTAVSSRSSSSVATIQSALLAAQSKGDLPILDKSESVNGVDSNNDGIRDDIKTYIDSLPDTPAQKKSLVQLSKALQYSLTIDPTDKVSVVLAANKIFAASSCIQFSYSSPSFASNRNQGIEKYLINTKVRLNAYSKFNVAASGGSYVLPEGDGCDAE